MSDHVGIIYPEDVEPDLTQDITFYNRPEEAQSIGTERLACTVSWNGNWRLFKMREGVPLQKTVGKPIGESWITLAFPQEELPLPISTRRTIAMNVFLQRKRAGESEERRKVEDLAEDKERSFQKGA